MVLYVILVIILSLILFGAILHSTYFKRRLNAVKPYGILVPVDDGQIHVYSIGSGEKTIVLLPGMGVPLPSADFGPLMRKLSRKYTVVCVEYFGVGFSSETTKERTCKNYVEETRSALKQAGFQPSYVLMAHSISTIYAEYYAAKYPDEIEAVISLDGSSTAFYGGKMPSAVKSLLPIIKFQQAIGLTSILGALATNKKSLFSCGYTEKEVDDSIIFSGFSINNTLLEQIASSSEFVKEVMDLPFPQSIPYFKVISRKTYETPNKQLKMTPQEYQQNHLQRIGPNAKYEILEGNHFIYINNIDRIAEITDEILKCNE